jgi:hypothetical protein
MSLLLNKGDDFWVIVNVYGFGGVVFSNCPPGTEADYFVTRPEISLSTLAQNRLLSTFFFLVILL